MYKQLTKINVENIRIILSETSHTGNMGSTARLQNMGLTNLYFDNQNQIHSIAYQRVQVMLLTMHILLIVSMIETLV